MELAEIRRHVITTVLERLSDSQERRSEAVNEFLGVTMPKVGAGSAEKVASLMPEIPIDLYRKWVTMFADRLLATLPELQLVELCNGSEENKATLSLVYIMFMESERMEKQIVEDLYALGLEQGQHDEVGNMLASYLRAKLAVEDAPTQ